MAASCDAASWPIWPDHLPDVTNLLYLPLPQYFTMSHCNGYVYQITLHSIVI